MFGVFGAHSHDPADRIDEAAATSEGIRAVQISLVVLAATAIIQIVITALSGSIALAADAIHNVSDACTAIPLWIAFALGRRPATSRYTYGFGRAEDLAGLFVVVMIALSAVIAGYESVLRLIDPVPVEHLGLVAAAGLAGFAGNELVAIYRIRTGRRIGSAALVADGLHARTDGMTSLAVVLGSLGVWLGFPLADPLVGLLITAMIVAVLWTALRDVLRRLLDAVDPTTVEHARQLLQANPSVRSVDGVRMRWVGHSLQAEAELNIDPALSLAQAHELGHGIEHQLTDAIPNLRRVLVHAYPAE